MERQTNPFSNSGGIVVELGKPYWMIACEYANLTDAEWRELTAWIARRRGSKSPFKAFRAMQRNPRGGASSCTVSAGGNGTITVNASPAAQVGDMIAYNAGAGGRAVVQLTASNGSNNFDCFPPAPSGSGSPEIVDAGGYFRLMANTVNMSDPFDPKKTLSFQARQVEPTY
jgi:hypothetical protein